MTTTVTLSDELESLQKNFSKIQVRSATSHFLTFTYERTMYARVQATLTFPQDYPSHALLVSISLVPPGLSKKLERDLEKVAQDLAVSSRPQQAEAVVQRLITFVDTNKFVPCWREVKQVVELFKLDDDDDDKKSTIALNERRGRIQLRFTNGGNQYFYACSITVNDNYPSTTTHENWGTACKLVLKETNFGTKIAGAITLQAKELVRHMQDGMSAERALARSNPIRAPLPTQVDNDDHDDDHQRGGAETNVVISTSVVTKGLQQTKDVRLRPGTKIITQSEWLQNEERRSLASFQLEDDHADPRPSLFPLISFLRSKIVTLPEETCPICDQLALPINPDELDKIYTSKLTRQKKIPLQTHCGCWYHHGCLHKLMVEPPFGAACPSCGKRVYHPNWPADIKELERDWTNRQARQREMDDAAMFL